MAVYYINLALILILAFPFCIYKPAKWKKALYIVVTFGYMWFLATFRYGIGYDFHTYIEIFEEIRALSGFSELWNYKIEPGYVFLTKLLTLFIHSPVAMYGAYALLIYLPIMWFIYRYCDNAWMATWLFVTLTFFYTSMNFTRQSLACSVGVLGYRFLKEKKAIPFLVVVLLAASIHRTALLLVPVYFLCHFKMNKKWAIFYSSATVVAFLTSGLILTFVTNYVFSSYKDSLWLTNGLSIVFLVVPVMVAGACMALYPAWSKRDPAATMLLNLMIYSLIIWLFITRHFILERFSMYIYIFVLVALPSAIAALKAPPEVYEQRDLLAAEIQGAKKKPGKEVHAKLKGLNQKISDHNKYYWSAAVAVILITAVYHEFGAWVNGFHSVFPYQSVLPWLN